MFVSLSQFVFVFNFEVIYIENKKKTKVETVIIFNLLFDNLCACLSKSAPKTKPREKKRKKKTPATTSNHQLSFFTFSSYILFEMYE